MSVLNVILIFICMGELYYIFRCRKQLEEWLAFFISFQEYPERKLFVKGNHILADINFELNGILRKTADSLQSCKERRLPISSY